MPPVAVPATDNVAPVPLKVAPDGTFIAPVSSLTPVPWNPPDTPPVAVPATDNVAPVPLKVGCVAEYEASPVLTVTSVVFIEAPVWV